MIANARRSFSAWPPKIPLVTKPSLKYLLALGLLVGCASAQTFDLGFVTDPCTGGALTTVLNAPFGADTTARYGNFTCKLPVANGPHILTFTFMENVATGPGQRLFQVKVNDQIIFDKLDLFISCGPLVVCNKAVFVAPTDGLLNIQFTTQTRNSIIYALTYTSFAPPPYDPTDHAVGFVVVLDNGELRQAVVLTPMVVKRMATCMGSLSTNTTCDGLAFFELTRPDGSPGGSWVGSAAPPNMVLDPAHWTELQIN